MIRPNSRQTALLCGPQGQRRRDSDWPATTPEEARTALAAWKSPEVFGAVLCSLKIGGLPSFRIAWYWNDPRDHTLGKLWLVFVGERSYRWTVGRKAEVAS